MGIVISQNFSLDDPDAGITGDHPVVGLHSIITAINTAASSADPLYPVTNLVNSATHLKWQAVAAGEVTLTITTLSADDVDYVAFARHNLWSQQISMLVEGDDGGGYFELVPEFRPAADGPILKRFDPQPLTSIRITLSEGDAAAAIAVLKVGKLNVFPRKLYQGMTPFSLARTAKISNGRAEAGNFLGRVVSQQFEQQKVPLSLITPYDYRKRVDPVIEASQDEPFFFAWRPESYPRELGYYIMTNDPMPVNQSPHGLVALSLEMTGVV